MIIKGIFPRDSKQLQIALNLDASTARIEVQCLLQEVLKVSRAWLLTRPEYLLDTEQQARYTALLERRLKGEPMAYLLGEREFYGLNFRVTPATLIPRPDTELLVELALQHLPQRGRMLDMGTGSGAIALSIAHARRDAGVVAVDRSEAALTVARSNMQSLGIQNVRLLQSDWFFALSGECFDLIVSNPPYIAAGDVHLGQGDVRFEPLSALVSGADGLDDLRRIVNGAQTCLKPGGWLMLEHGYDQAAQVRHLMQQAGFYEVASSRDLSGTERVTTGHS